MARLHLFSHHLRHAGSQLRRSPGTSLLAVTVLAFGIALNATTFSLVNGLVLRGLPFEDGDRYVYVASTDPHRRLPVFRMSAHDFVDMRGAQTSFESFVAYVTRAVNLSDDVDFPELRRGCYASHGFFASASFQPHLGRTFGPGDDQPGAPAVAVIAYHMWQQRFQADPEALGRKLRVDGELAEVVGVMPPGFRFPLREEIWLPLRLDVARHERGEGTPLRVFGRLRAGVGEKQARAELAAVAGRLAEEHPETNEDRGVETRPYIRQFMAPAQRQVFWVLMALVTLGLLISCANVASLLMARAISRLRDLATFSALGAGRAQVMGYVLGESLLLAVLGALAGIALTFAGIEFLAAEMAWIDMPFWMRVTLDARVMVFMMALTVTTALAAGLYPAHRASSAELTSFLHGTRGAAAFAVGRFVRLLVVAQVAVAGLLLICTGLALRSLANLNDLDLGVDVERVYTARLILPEGRYPKPADRVAFADELITNLGARPDVGASAATTHLPTAGFGTSARYSIEGQTYAAPEERPRTHRVAVTPGFFGVFAIPVLRGRLLTSEDRADTPGVAVVNRSFAERAWPGEEALGKRLSFSSDTPSWLTVVGVVGDLWPGSVSEGDQSGVYVAYAQHAEVAMAIAIRALRKSDELATLLRRESWSLDAGLPLFENKTAREVVDAEMFQSRLFGRIVTVLGVLSMLLAAIGIYGVNVFSVNRRTPEIGVRMAMGAERGAILTLILRRGLLQAGLGLAVGLGAAFAVTPLLELILFEVPPRDPVTWLVTALLLALVVLKASFVPAWRASRIDPVDALRDE